jgi:myosin-1
MATKNGKVLTMVDEKTISLNVISGISVSTLQDDWVVLHVDSSPDGDTILSCTFKTELLAHILQQTDGRIKVSVVPQIQYKKKGGKAVTMKFVKDETAKGDGIYKSHVVKICSGEPAGSQSRPPCAVKARPTQNSTRRAAAAPRKTPANANRTAPRPVAAATTVASSRPMANNTGRAVPPPPPPPAQAATPPPPPPPAPATPQYKAIYPFQSQEAGEIAFEKGDLLEIVEKDENGWWLARKDGIEGWVPSNYLEEYVPPVARATPPPPPPPARRAPPSIPIANKVSSPPPASASSTVPAWKAELEARKSGAIPNSGASSGSIASPVPAARRGPPAPGPKPIVPAKPSGMGKPVVPSRPGMGAPTPAPRAPPRASNGTPSNAAASLADAVSFFRTNL